MAGHCSKVREDIIPIDPKKDIRGNVEDGASEVKALIDAYNEVSDRFAEPMSDDEMNGLLEQQGESRAH